LSAYSCGGRVNEALMTRRTENPALEVFAVSPAKAGEILGGGRTKIYELLAQGELESFWIGRSRRVTLESIRAFLDRRLAESRRRAPPRASR
jgi:excisionase family DNA binding protein